MKPGVVDSLRMWEAAVKHCREMADREREAAEEADELEREAESLRAHGHVVPPRPMGARHQRDGLTIRLLPTRRYSVQR